MFCPCLPTDVSCAFPLARWTLPAPPPLLYQLMLTTGSSVGTRAGFQAVFTSMPKCPFEATASFSIGAGTVAVRGAKSVIDQFVQLCALPSPSPLVGGVNFLRLVFLRLVFLRPASLSASYSNDMTCIVTMTRWVQCWRFCFCGTCTTVFSVRRALPFLPR